MAETENLYSNNNSDKQKTVIHLMFNLLFFCIETNPSNVIHGSNVNINLLSIPMKYTPVKYLNIVKSINTTDIKLITKHTTK